MEKTTSRKLARRRLLEAQQQAAAAAREQRERANMTDMTEFTVRMAQVDKVDAWYAGRVEKLKEEADRKRHAHRVAAGKALHAMRLRGETMASMSATTGLSVSRLARTDEIRLRRPRRRCALTGAARRTCGGVAQPCDT